jgi:hypothetical protein
MVQGASHRRNRRKKNSQPIDPLKGRNPATSNTGVPRGFRALQGRSSGVNNFDKILPFVPCAM